MLSNRIDTHEHRIYSVLVGVSFGSISSVVAFSP